MARTRAVPRRRPNINFQQRGNIDFERQRVAATRNIISSGSSSSSSTSPARNPTAAAAAAAIPARTRSPLGNLARNLANGIGRNIRIPSISPPASPIPRPRRRVRRRISSESSSASSFEPASALPVRRRRRIRAYDVKIKFALPRVKDVEVKHNGRIVRKMKVRRVAKHAAKKRNVRYGL